MSESYTTGGDTLQSIDSPLLAGQTFHPKETHVLEFIDLEMRGAMYINDPVIQIFFADSNHEPYGECLSRDLWIVEKKSSLFAIGRVRFKMQPLLLVQGLYYCIWAGNFPVLLGNPASWQYDAGDASYPGGIRISSSDSGETWTKHYNDDHIFAEFGDPPLPTPEPPPPIDNFAILGMDIRHFTNAILFRHATSVPCHLTLYWTDEKPRTHHQARTVRGLAVPWRTYFCFVAWHEVEQEEPGDTLYHTFIVDDWILAQVRWFTLRGEVDFELSPSVGPIFKHTHPGQDIILNPSLEYWNDALNIPLNWTVRVLPGDPPWFSPSTEHVREGTYAALSSIPVNFKLQQLISLPDTSFLSNRTLKFQIAYYGYKTNFNTFNITAWGDILRFGNNRPTKHYDWEERSVTLTMPPNIYKLELNCFNNNQNFPLPFQNWWDDVQLFLL